MLIISALLLIFIGLVHSYLGEKHILTRLFKRELPKLFGSDILTKQVLRFAWHLTTIAWFGFAAILVVLSSGSPDFFKTSLYIISFVFLISGAMSFGYTKGMHYSYFVFWAVTIICGYVASAS
jgi:hypothetical protein